MNSNKDFQRVIREKAIQERDKEAMKDVETLGELAQKIADYGKREQCQGKPYDIQRRKLHNAFRKRYAG